MWDFVRKPVMDRSGVTAIEYGLLIGVVAMSLFFGMNVFTNQLTNVFNGISDHSKNALK